MLSKVLASLSEIGICEILGEKLLNEYKTGID